MTNAVVQTVLLLALGLVQCFFGYPLFRLLVVLVGALAGYAYGPQLVTLLTGEPPLPWTGFAVGVLAALVVGSLAWGLYWVVVFLWGASVGYGASVAAGQELWLCLLVAVVVGVFAVLFQRVLIVAITAVAGATLAVAAFLQLGGFGPVTGGFDPDLLEPWTVILIAFLAVFGAIVQFRSAGGGRAV